jgi:hypothetical protein
MARDWNARPAPRKTTITEVARRYHAAAVALAQTLGLSVPEVFAQHRESVTAIFIECGRCDLRVPAGVQLPPLASKLLGASTPSQGDETAADAPGSPSGGEPPRPFGLKRPEQRLPATPPSPRPAA